MFNEVHEIQHCCDDSTVMNSHVPVPKASVDSVCIPQQRAILPFARLKVVDKNVRICLYITFLHSTGTVHFSDVDSNANSWTWLVTLATHGNDRMRLLRCRRRRVKLQACLQPVTTHRPKALHLSVMRIGYAMLFDGIDEGIGTRWVSGEYHRI